MGTAASASRYEYGCGVVGVGCVMGLAHGVWWGIAGVCACISCG
jgi:hypothetical protein